MFDLAGNRPIDPMLLRTMNDTQAHRGPDGADIYLAPGIGLGHRRLAIIDLAGGHQPLFNEDGSIVVVYNGEIYNFDELARELKRLGHRLRTHCDTEVIVHAWEQWGEDCLHRFRGMFAFALWDANQRRLFLARDRLGIKPLYYAQLDNGILIFASELKGLIAHPKMPRTIDPAAVEDFFALGYVPDPKTIYRGAAKLPPGHFMVVDRTGRSPRPRRYWNLRFGAHQSLSVEEASEQLIARLREAVSLRMIADVPLGAFLSGGVDSSAVVALMAMQSRDPVNTCSVAFGEGPYDESPFAMRIAGQYGTRHRLRRADPLDVALMEQLAGVYDEPFADSSALPTMIVCALARQDVTVALSGDGGDEVFAGYRRYRWHHYEEQVRSRLPAGFRRLLFGQLGRLYPKMDWAPQALRAKTTFQGIARDSIDAYYQSVSMIDDTLRDELFSPALHRDLQGYRTWQLFKTLADEAETDHHLEQAQYVDFKSYLAGDILTKVDRASMAHGLEVRVPILDHCFVEWAATVPPHLKLTLRQGKAVFKRALEPYLPQEILYRKKMGFSIPLAQWLRGPWREAAHACLNAPAMEMSGMFDRKTIGKLLKQHNEGTYDRSAAIWALMMFSGFLSSVHAAPASSFSQNLRSHELRCWMGDRRA
jgi:asparagine synthase (glutamine-hydrolysing)